MRAREFIIERFDISWIQPWIVRSAGSIKTYSNDADWYSRFFKNLSKDQEFVKWRDSLKFPLKIQPKIKDDQTSTQSVLGGEHYTDDDPIQHIVSIEVNLARTPTDDKTFNVFLNRLSTTMAHELNHASQRDKQLRKFNDADQVFDLKSHSIFKNTPPEPTGSNKQLESYYLYLLDHMETDAFVSGAAQEITNSLGSNSLKSLNHIFQAVKKDQYVTVAGKIINLPALKSLHDALGYYETYLKRNREYEWDRIKKRLYQYIKKQ